MTTVNASDPSVSLSSLMLLIRRGESVQLTEDGAAVATMVPTATEMDADSRPWRGVFTDVPAVTETALPPEPPLPLSRVEGPNLNWLIDREEGDE